MYDCDGNCIAETSVGCDCGVLLDECGVCNGDGSACAPVDGGTDSNACNYNPDANIDDGGGEAGPEENYDCDGNCIVNIDCDGVCGGECAEGRICGFGLLWLCW